MPLPPSIIVASGHGLHAYWLLHEPWLFENDDDRHRAASVLPGRDAAAALLDMLGHARTLKRAGLDSVLDRETSDISKTIPA